MSRYRKEYRIGAGGMGQVFRVTRVLENGTETPAACKVMRGQLARDARGVRLFCREAVLGLAVGNDDPNVVSVYDFLARSAPDGERTFYLIMELVEGVDLRELMSIRERLSFDMLRCIARDLLSGLRYLHKRGVLHRDLSPSNVLISVAGVAKVTDLGVAKFVTPDGLQSESIHGKPAYLAPEMGDGRPVDGRADLFAFAATMYHLLAGAAPLGSTLPEIVGRRAEWRIDDLPADVPGDLREVVIGLLRQEPRERVAQTAGDALAMLAEPAERDAVAAGLGAIVGELYARKLERWQRQQSERAKVAESEEHIDAEPVLEGFADTVRHTSEEGNADEERHETEAVDTDSWRPMAPNAGEADQGGEAEEANGARVAGNRPRLALAMMLAVAAVATLAIIGDVRLGGDQPAPIVWQLVQPPVPRDDLMHAPGEERAEEPRPAPEAAPGEEPRTAPDDTPDEERHAETSAPTPEVGPGKERSAEEPRPPRASTTVKPRSDARAAASPSMHREPPASAEVQTAATRPPKPAEEPPEPEGPPWFSGVTMAYASEHP